MYRVYLDGALLYDPRVEELQLFDKKLALAVNKSGAFDFTIYPTHPLYDAIDRLKSAIEVYKDDVLLFRGRVLDDTIDFYNAKRVICEGDLGFLNDGIIRPYDYSGTITGFMRLVLDEYNAQVNPEKQFSIGTITVTDQNDYIVRSSIEADSAWNVINDKLVGLLGGYIMVRRENGANFIDYLADATRVSSQEITLGENLLGLNKDNTGQDIITALIPYGARVKDAEGNETDTRIGIVDVNNGLDYVHDADAVSTYGWIFGTATWNDVTVPANLLTKAREALSRNIHAHTGIEVNAVDLSMADVSIDDFRIFEYIKVKSAVHDLDDLMLVSKLDIDLDNPQNNKLFIGMERETLADMQSKTRNIIKETTRETKAELVQIIQTAANGKNRIFRGVTEPNKGMMVNDLWYKPVGEGETMLYTWNGGIWELSKVSTGLLVGTLDAENGDVNLINVNVANIVGETSEFVRSNWNAINSSATIDGTGIRVVHSDGTYTKLGADGLKRFTAGDNRNYHYLMYATTFVYGDSSPSTARWIQLPDDFKGKDFDIFFAIADSLNAVDYFHSIQRFVCTQHPDFEIDYANARVPVIAYKSETQNDGLDPDIRSVQGLMIALH